jgi:hypothetical protein
MRIPRPTGPEPRGTRAFACTAPGEKRYFYCPFDRCELAPVSHTVSQRSGKGPSPIGPDPCLLSGRAGSPLNLAWPSLRDNDGWDASLPPTRRPLRPVECSSSVRRIITGLTMARIESLDVVAGAGQAPIH